MRRTAASLTLVLAGLPGVAVLAQPEADKPSLSVPASLPAEPAPKSGLKLAQAEGLGEGQEPAGTQQGRSEPADETLRRQATPPAYQTVVVGQRRPENPWLSSRSVSAISAAELAERSPRTTPEALWDTTGAFVQQTNHGGGAPILRGMVGPQNLILVDGVRLNNSLWRTGPLQYLNLLDPLALDRLEVLRGPGSVLYGSDAMGGVIQALPLSPSNDSTRSLRSGGLLYRMSAACLERTGHGHLSVGTGPTALVGSVTYKAFDNLFGGKSVGEQAYSGYEQWNAMGRLEHRLATGPLAGSTLSAVYLGARIAGAGRTDKLVDARSLQIYDNEDHLAYGRLEVPLRRIRTRGTLTFSYQRFFEAKDTFGMAADLRSREKGVRDEVTADSFGMDLQLYTRLVDNRIRLQYGALFYQDWVQADRWGWSPGAPWALQPAASYTDGSTYRNLGGYLLLEGDLLRTRGGQILRAGGGYRLSGMGGDAPAFQDLPAVRFSALGHVFFGNLQALLGTGFNAALTFSQGFRAPNLNEAAMVGDTGKYYHVVNPSLGPERSDTLELVLRTRLWRLRAEAAGYFSRLDDLIKREETSFAGQTEVGGKPVAHNVNGGRGTLWGGEGRLALDLPLGLSARASLSYTRGSEQIEGQPDQPLTRIPPLFGQGGLRWDWQRGARWRGYLEANLRWAAAQSRLSPEDIKDVRIPEGGTPAWVTVNARAGLEAYGRLRAGFGIENLLDAKYKYHGSGVYGAGRNAMLTLETVF